MSVEKDLRMTVEQLADEVIKWEAKAVAASNDGNMLVASLLWRMCGRYELLLALKLAGVL